MSKIYLQINSEQEAIDAINHCVKITTNESTVGVISSPLEDSLKLILEMKFSYNENNKIFIDFNDKFSIKNTTQMEIKEDDIIISVEQFKIAKFERVERQEEDNE